MVIVDHSYYHQNGFAVHVGIVC